MILRRLSRDSIQITFRSYIQRAKGLAILKEHFTLVFHIHNVEAVFFTCDRKKFSTLPLSSLIIPLSFPQVNKRLKLILSVMPSQVILYTARQSYTIHSSAISYTAILYYIIYSYIDSYPTVYNKYNIRFLLTKKIVVLEFKIRYINICYNFSWGMVYFYLYCAKIHKKIFSK